MAEEVQDHYAVLGVSQGASLEEIKREYRKLARKWHPDQNKAPDAEARFKAITEANATLSNPEKREAYDRSRLSVPNTFGAGAPFDIRDFLDKMGGFGGNAPVDTKLRARSVKRVSLSSDSVVARAVRAYRSAVDVASRVQESFVDVQKSVSHLRPTALERMVLQTRLPLGSSDALVDSVHEAAMLELIAQQWEAGMLVGPGVWDEGLQATWAKLLGDRTIVAAQKVQVATLKSASANPAHVQPNDGAFGGFAQRIFGHGRARAGTTQQPPVSKTNKAQMRTAQASEAPGSPGVGPVRNPYRATARRASERATPNEDGPPVVTEPVRPAEATKPTEPLRPTEPLQPTEPLAPTPPPGGGTAGSHNAAGRRSSSAHAEQTGPTTLLEAQVQKAADLLERPAAEQPLVTAYLHAVLQKGVEAKSTKALADAWEDLSIRVTLAQTFGPSTYKPGEVRQAVLLELARRSADAPESKLPSSTQGAAQATLEREAAILAGALKGKGRRAPTPSSTAQDRAVLQLVRDVQQGAMAEVADAAAHDWLKAAAEKGTKKPATRDIAQRFGAAVGIRSTSADAAERLATAALGVLAWNEVMDAKVAEPRTGIAAELMHATTHELHRSGPDLPAGSLAGGAH